MRKDSRKVNCGRGLPASPLLIDDCDRPHGSATPGCVRADPVRASQQGRSFLSEQQGAAAVIFAHRYTPPTMTDDQTSQGNRPRKSTGTLLVTIGLIAALIGGAIWIWEEVLEDRLIAKRFGVVVPGSIYRSGQLSQWMVHKTLAEHDIDLVVHLGVHDPENKAHAAEAEAVEALGIERRLFPLRGDGEGVNFHGSDVSAPTDHWLAKQVANG